MQKQVVYKVYSCKLTECEAVVEDLRFLGFFALEFAAAFAAEPMDSISLSLSSNKICATTSRSAAVDDRCVDEACSWSFFFFLSRLNMVSLVMMASLPIDLSTGFM